MRTSFYTTLAYQTSTLMIVGVRTLLNPRAAYETLSAYEEWGVLASEAKPERIALINDGVRTFLNPRAAHETSTFVILGVRTLLNHRAIQLSY